MAGFFLDNLFQLGYEFVRINSMHPAGEVD